MSDFSFKVGDSVYLKSDEFTIQSINGNICKCKGSHDGKEFTLDLQSEMLQKSTASLGMRVIGADEGFQMDLDSKKAE